MVKQTVQKNKCGSGFRSGSDGFVEKSLELNPVFNLNNREENTDESSDTFLDEKVSLLDIL